MECKIELDFQRAGAVNIIKELKECKDNLVVFGAGLMAKMVTDILKKYGIHYCAVCTDHADIENDEMKDCLRWDEINDRYEKYSVVVAHAPNLNRIEALKKNEKIRRIFFLHSYDIELFNADIVAKHVNEYEQVLELLQDTYSRECIIAYLNTKMTGDMRYILELFKKEMNCFVNAVWSITENESFWDVGAYTGNLIQEFMAVSQGKYNQIVALEPDQESFRRLRLCLGKRKGIFAYNCGAWEEKGYRAFIEDERYRLCGRCAMENEICGHQIECVTLDSLLEESAQLSNPTLLRFNYGAGVAEALRGAEKILSTYQPKLAVCIGFDEISFVDIIHEIKKINPNYKFYIRFQRCIASALNLYAL